MRALRVLGVFFSILLVSVPAVSAQPTEMIETLAVRLPHPWREGATVWTGVAAYLLGGAWVVPGVEIPILRFDPATNTLEEESVRLPCARISAVWTGAEILAFGGYCDDMHETSARVWRYDPVAGSLDVVGELPSPRDETATVFDGRYAYVLSGSGANETNREIVRYNPETGESVVVSRDLPDVLRYPRATWDGERIVVFTVYGPRWFHPDTGEMTDAGFAATFPSATNGPAVQAGTSAYLIGGLDAYDRREVDRIVRYDSHTNTWELLSIRLERPLSDHAATWAGDRALIFGGKDQDQSYDTIQILRFQDTLPLILGVGVSTVAASVAVVYLLHRRRRKSASPSELSPAGPQP